jgi:nucleotide-binding universal stress UspA family protein
MKLLVPLDGSAPSRKALDHALWIAARQPGALIILLNVQNAETLGFSDIKAKTGNERALAARESEVVFQEPIRACRDHHVQCDTLAEYGPVADTINRVAHQTRADQIVMGTRGLGRLRGLILGSVATQVVHLADVPVTLVKEDRKAVAISEPIALSEQVAVS